jgi:hypothetical protein
MFGVAMRKFAVVTFGILGLALLPQASEAGVITGILDIAGSVLVSNTTIDWGSNGGGTGVVMVANTSTFMDGPTLVNSGNRHREGLVVGTAADDRIPAP